LDTAIRDHVIRSLRESAEVRQAVIDYCTDSNVAAGSAIHHALEQGGKLILLGNGGSAADAQHISAEFTGRFMKDRAPLAAIALTTDTSALTAIGNDYGYDQVFTRQIQALGRPNDVVLAISTSGRSLSVLAAVEAARIGGMATIGLTGRDGGPLAQIVDVAIRVPVANTARMQECHLTIEHILCEVVEQLLGVA
jgi:D-sedoheptulose 7-phosphate isomerase